MMIRATERLMGVVRQVLQGVSLSAPGGCAGDPSACEFDVRQRHAASTVVDAVRPSHDPSDTAMPPTPQ